MVDAAITWAAGRSHRHGRRSCATKARSAARNTTMAASTQMENRMACAPGAKPKRSEAAVERLPKDR